MRNIYLIRHARPDFPTGETYCIGRTDMPIGTLGRLQCVLLGRENALSGIKQVYCSRLSRAVQTAEYLCACPETVDGLEEMDAGEWDGLSFSEIKAAFPEIYYARGRDSRIPIPGSEDISDGEKRFEEAVYKLIANTEGDIAVVSHCTVIRSLIAKLNNTPMDEIRAYCLPYCSYTRLEYDGSLSVKEYGINNVPPMTDGLADELLKAAGCTERIIRHCHAVCREAMRIYSELEKHGAVLSRDDIYYAALLHDIARKENDHPAVGALWLDALGYPKLAGIVSQHHDFIGPEIDEAAIVYLADKCVIEDMPVAPEKRFENAENKCTGEEALEALRRRRGTAYRLKNEINKICGEVVIP